MDALLRWLTRTPVQTFVLCPLVVIAFEFAWHDGRPVVVPWGALLMAWGYLQYLFVGRYRMPRAGGSWGIEIPPDQIVATGPYRYTRNPMYVGLTLILIGVWLLLGTASAALPIAIFVWIIQSRFIRGEERFLDEIFGEQYRGYKSRVRRWI